MTNTPPDTIEQLHRSAESLSNDELPAGWDIVSSSAYAKVAGNTELAIFYKEFLPRSPLETVKAWFRGSRAHRARRNSDALNFAGFDAPENLTWGTLANGREYLFTRAARGQGVDQWLQLSLAERSADNVRQRWLLVAELGTFIGRLHATGFTHGDLRTSNILTEFRSGRFYFTLIDNERNHYAVPAPGKLVLKNLMQLNMMAANDLSKNERIRFFRGWRRQMRQLSETESKIIATDAYLWARRRLAAKGIS
jgi:hypothetical protein